MKKVMIGFMASVSMMVAGGNLAPVAPVEVKSSFVPYVGAGVSYLTDEDEYYGTVLGGVQYGDYVAAEARGSWKGSKGGDTYGVYLKPIIPAVYGVNVYGLVGYEKVYNYANTKTNVSDLAFGGGLEYKGVFADATYNRGTEDTRVSLGYIYRF